VLGLWAGVSAGALPFFFFFFFLDYALHGFTHRVTQQSMGKLQPQFEKTLGAWVAPASARSYSEHNLLLAAQKIAMPQQSVHAIAFVTFKF